MIIFESLLTTLERSLFFEAAGAVAKIGLRLNQTKPKPPLTSYLVDEILPNWGQFHQPIGAKCKWAGTQSLAQSFSPPKLRPTVPVHTTKSYAQLFTLYALRHMSVSSA